MSNIVNLFKNKLDRIVTKKEVITVAVLIIPIMIAAAVLFAARTGMKANIVLVAENPQGIPYSSKFKIEVMDKRPAESELLLGNYDFIVEEKTPGSYEVSTVIKSKADKETVENFFNNGQSPEGYDSEDLKRGLGTKILGFIAMVVMMQGVALTLLYPEDRTLKTFRRILTAPVSGRQYILVQGLFTLLCLYIPTYLAIAVTGECFGIKIGFGPGMQAVLIGLLTALATAFALFISSVLKDNISLAASGISVITCLLAGCYSSFTAGSKLLDTLCSIIPQKAYMTLLEGVEKGNGLWNFKVQLAYILVWIAALLLMGGIVTRSRMKEGI